MWAPPNPRSTIHDTNVEVKAESQGRVRENQTPTEKNSVQERASETRWSSETPRQIPQRSVTLRSFPSPYHRSQRSSERSSVRRAILTSHSQGSIDWQAAFPSKEPNTLSEEFRSTLSFSGPFNYITTTMSTLKSSKVNAGTSTARSSSTPAMTPFRQRLLMSTKSPSSAAKQSAQSKGQNGAAANKEVKSEATIKIQALEKKQAELLEQQKAVEDENEKLKKKVSVLEALLSEEREDPERFSSWRLRTLKTQNMELQKQLSAIKSSLTVSKEAREILKKHVSDFQSKVSEFKAFEPIIIPKPKPDSTKKKPVSPSLGSRTSPGSGRLSYSSPGGRTTSPGSPAGRKPISSPQKAGSPSRANQKATPGSPGHRTSPGSNMRLCQRPDLEELGYIDSESLGPPPVPKVAVDLEWLQNGDDWAKGVLESLENTPAEILQSESIAGVTIGGKNGIDVALFQANLNPFLVGKKEKKEGEDENISPEIAQEVLDSLNFEKIHNLELQLGEIHPELSKVAGLLKTLVLPSLPSESAHSLSKELENVNLRIYNAAKDLAQFSMVVPGKSSLIGAKFEASESTEISVLKGGSIVRNAPKLPNLDDFLAALPSEIGEDTEILEKLEALVTKLRLAEATWTNEMKGLQDEMAFYQKCHAVNSAHVKIVAQSARNALEVILGEAVKSCSSAAEAILQIMEALQQHQEEPSSETEAEILKQVQNGAPTLVKFLELLPEKLKLGEDEKVGLSPINELMDPVEKEYKEKLQEIFDKLQASRNARYKPKFSGSSSTRGNSPSRTTSFRK